MDPSNVCTTSILESFLRKVPVFFTTNLRFITAGLLHREPCAFSDFNSFRSCAKRRSKVEWSRMTSHNYSTVR